MTGNLTSSTRSRPICGVLSLALPLLFGAATLIVMRSGPEGDSGWLATDVFALCATMASMLAGVILAIIALIRRERWPVLPWFAIVLNAAATVPLVRMVFF